MDQIIQKIKQIIRENIKMYLPYVKPEELEGNGTVFYVNGKNGTAFDWYVNEHLPYFYVFYNDQKNLGAAKLALYHDGTVALYLFDDHGEKFIQDIYTSSNVSEDDLFRFGVVVTYSHHLR